MRAGSPAGTSGARRNPGARTPAHPRAWAPRRERHGRGQAVALDFGTVALNLIQGSEPLFSAELVDRKIDHAPALTFLNGNCLTRFLKFPHCPVRAPSLTALTKVVAPY